MVQLYTLLTLLLMLTPGLAAAATLEELCTVKSAKNFSNEELISKIQSMLQCQNGIGATLQETRNMPFYPSVPESLEVLSEEYQRRVSSGKLNSKNRQVADLKGILEGVKKDVARLGTSGSAKPTHENSQAQRTSSPSDEKSKVWTPVTFEESCKSIGGEIHKTSSDDRLHLECKKNGNEIRSAWFDNKTTQMTGFLKRVRNDKNHVVKDLEFDSAGKLKETSFYLKTSADPVQPQNMFVFDGENKLRRGNIMFGKDNYVIATPTTVFHNGEASALDKIQKALSQQFQVTASVPVYDQVSQIWLNQNGGKHQPPSVAEPGAK